MNIPGGQSLNDWIGNLGLVSLGTPDTIARLRSQAFESGPRVSRMREIRTSGSMRGAAALTLCPFKGNGALSQPSAPSR